MLKPFACLGIGELLWDLLPGGRQLGGAPANFAFHCSSLGGAGQVLSRIGDDPAGHEILARLAQLGLNTDAVQLDPKAPTGSVGVELNEDKSASYAIYENVAWDFLAADESARATAANADAICFGSLAQRNRTSRISIRQLLDCARRDSLRIFDINLRQNYFSKEIIEQSIARASILKINDQELPVVAGLFNLAGDERAQLQRLTERDNLRGIAYTRGDRGSALLIDGEWSDHPGVPTNVVDTIGAGDSFTAAMTIGLLLGWPLPLVHDQATRVAAFVCSQAGATPTLPEKLTASFTSR